MNFKFWKKKPSLNCDKCKTQLNQYSIDENNIEWILKNMITEISVFSRTTFSPNSS